MTQEKYREEFVRLSSNFKDKDAELKAYMEKHSVTPGEKEYRKFSELQTEVVSALLAWSSFSLRNRRRVG